jgi:hypothetical protein
MIPDPFIARVWAYLALCNKRTRADLAALLLPNLPKSTDKLTLSSAA